jgi:TonB family protein
MRVEKQGRMLLETVVLPDGAVGDVRVPYSLDWTTGLDQEAIAAAKQWRFMPGQRKGHTVPMLVTVELSYTGGRPGQPAGVLLLLAETA